MTIENERLIEYLELQLELCYLKSNGEAVWIVADRIRRKDKIAIEVLRIFNRFMRIGKAFDRVNARTKAALELPGTTATPTTSNNAPYARCIGVRVCVKEHVASSHIRPGVDAQMLRNAPRLKANTLLDPSFDLSLDDPILGVLTAPSSTTAQRALPEPSAPSKRRKIVPPPIEPKDES